MYFTLHPSYERDTDQVPLLATAQLSFCGVCQTMSAEQEKPAEEATAGAPSEKNKDQKKNNRQDRKRDETPIEELFDLSQPIPKVSSRHT